VHETAPASYGWATVKNSNTNTMFDIVRADPSAVHPPLEAWIQRDVAVELMRAAGQDFEALKRRAQSREFRPVTLNGATFSASYGVRRSNIRSRNVLGRIPGSTRPNETILYGGHWDHLGVGRPDARGDSIYNGAVDNATGIAAVIEIARAFAAGPRPERSVVFAAWTVEEKGLLGSEYYAANPVYPLETTAAGFNVDALAPTGPARDVLVVGYGQSELEDRLERALAASGRVIARDPHPEAGYFYRSDHFPMAKRGVPMLYVDSGVDLLTGGAAAGDAADAAYRRDRYHQPADEFDAATWRFDGIAQDVAVLGRLGREVADSRAWPNYRAGSEFRPVRDASAGRRRGRAGRGVSARHARSGPRHYSATAPRRFAVPEGEPAMWSHVVCWRPRPAPRMLGPPPHRQRRTPRTSTPPPSRVGGSMPRSRLAVVLLAAAVLAPAVAAAQAPAARQTAGGRAPRTGGIPAGRYTTTLTRADLARRVPAAEVDSMVGPWTMTFDSTGHFTVERNGTQIVQGVAQPRPGRRVYFDAKDTGPAACHMPATYRYTVQGDRLTLRKVSDKCDGRAAVLTSHPHTRGG
jgi:Zn-dependent M28 family amino/carboxypeptidase